MTRMLERWALLLAAMPLLVICARAVAEDPAPPKQAPEPEAQVLIPRAARHGGWGGPVVQVSTVRDQTAVLVGGRGGWIVDRRFTIGGGGFGLVNEIPAPPEAHGTAEQLDLKMGYGGGWVEYTFAPLRLLHVSIGALVGGGELSLAYRGGGAFGSRNDGFFVAEPAIVAELNLATSVRVDVGAAYRWIEGVEMEGLSRSDVAGLSVVAAVKFGKF
jgi:hypothetical protein